MVVKYLAGVGTNDGKIKITSVILVPEQVMKLMKAGLMATVNGKKNLIRKKDKPLTKKEWEEIFAKILTVAAQVIIAVFLCAVVIYSIF